MNQFFLNVVFCFYHVVEFQIPGQSLRPMDRSQFTHDSRIYAQIHFRHITRFHTVHRPARSPLRMSVITATHSSIQLIPGMLMGRVPPSGLIKRLSWEGSQFQRHAHSHLQSINALSFAVGYGLKPGHPLSPSSNSRLQNIHAHKNYTLRERYTRGNCCGLGGEVQWFLILY